MKHNFVVSDFRKVWLPGAKRLFVLEPYVRYRLERTGNLKDYDEVVEAPFRRSSSEDLLSDHRFVQEKFEKYVGVLGDRLNRIHGTSHDRIFWRKALSLSFERYITFMYEVYSACELHFRPEVHACRVISKCSYHIPSEFDDQRIFFQHSDYGQEQIFSTYMHVFHPAGLETIDVVYEPNPERDAAGQRKPLLRRLLDQKLFSRSVFEKVLSKLLTWFYAHRTHTLGMMGAFFPARYQNLLMARSGGAIFPVPWVESFAELSAMPIDRESRTKLSLAVPDFDRFDRFFFASMEFCLPKIFVENFKEIENRYFGIFAKFPHLKNIASEGWLSSSSLSIGLALLHERGVQHIYNEHNYFEHPWVGSMVSKEASLSDKFISMGWDCSRIPNSTRGASLFDFMLSASPRKTIKICFIGSGASAKRPNFTASYGWACENAPKYFDFMRRFFCALQESTLGEMVYRGYPLADFHNWLAYDQNYMLAPYLSKVPRPPSPNLPCKLMMLQSQLVVIDYISTSYLESLLMNIPTIFFWNSEAYYLSPEYADFFAPLLDAGICHNDPEKAARFLEGVKSDPLKWWLREDVQRARKQFLRCNLGKPETMVNILLEMARSEMGNLESAK